ncbi:MAG: DNA gyrase inhibitor YacG [Sphingobium sp.]|nr:DNA gyrase inhibitor YacG [Sphingobium sp.]
MANTACPICGKPATPAHKPFCSRGCTDRDLLKWLSEGYRLPRAPMPGMASSSAIPTLPG